MTYDLAGIKRSVSLHETASLYGIRLIKNGNEYEALCPFHSEKTPSFQIWVGDQGHEVYHCKGCGAHGDVIDFVRELKGVSLPGACEILAGTGQAPDNRPAAKAGQTGIYDDIEPVSVQDHPFRVGEWAECFNPKREKTSKFCPTLIHEYRNADGSLYGLVVRNDLPGGRKETPMLRHVRLPDGRQTWCRFPFARPRPLYGLEGLSPDKKQVIVVEGEKAADSLRARTGRCVVTWPGGTNGTRYVDWRPLAGRDMVLWPDYDQPGRAAMIEGYPRRQEWQPPVASILASLGCRVRWVDIDRWDWSSPLPKGHDAADLPDWDSNRTIAFIRHCVTDWQPPREPDEIVPPLPKSAGALPSESGPHPAEEPDSDYPDGGEHQIIDARTAVEKLHWFDLGKTSKDGVWAASSTHNHLLVLDNHPLMKGVLGRNEFSNDIEFRLAPPWEPDQEGFSPRAISDDDYVHAASWMESPLLGMGDQVRLTVKPTTMPALFSAVASRNRFDPLRHYLDSLRWDMKPRIHRLLHDYFICEAEGDYNEIIARRFMIACVARALDPGCKMDTMLVVEGNQGIMKSSTFQALFGRHYFADHLSDVESKDAHMEQQGVWGIEIAEMHEFNKKDANAVKRFMTQQEDRYRPPYGRNVIKVPRRSVMVGTVNLSGKPYLKDVTGARRFWPIEARDVNRQKTREDRDQLWAEAVCLYRAGNPWWVQQEEENIVLRQQSYRIVVDPWEGRISQELQDMPRAEYRVDDMYAVIGIPRAQVSGLHLDRICAVMFKYGYELKRGDATRFARRRDRKPPPQPPARGNQ